MRLRIALGLVLGLTACGGGGQSRGDSPPAGEAEAEASSGAEKVECAVGGAASFERACIVERMSGPDGLELTLRHPDGGFRRLKVTKDGRGVVPADGAEGAKVSIVGDNRIEVAIGADRYRLPATVKK